jgi:hypothetical protein
MSNPCQEVWDDTVGQEVPKMDTKSMGLLMLILNIFFPGIGSIVRRPLLRAGALLRFLGGACPLLTACPCAQVAGLKADKTSTMIIGVLQFVSSWLILGWIWSIYWGWLIYQKSGGGFSQLGV